MRQAFAFLLAILLTFVSTFSSEAQNFGLLNPVEDNIFYYNARGPLQLHCNIVSDGSAIVWTKNGKPLAEVSQLQGRVEFLKGGAIFKIIGRSDEEDYGKYTCSAGSASRTWDVRGRPRAKIPANTFVSEGEHIKLICKVIGKPYPATVQWLYSDKSEKVTKDTPEAQAILGSRVKLSKSEQGIADALLTLGPAELTDEGWLTCRPEGESMSGTTRLRVKDKYAALWPFLGICAEVLLLCLIILCFEKRYKKPVLDDDDTETEEHKNVGSNVLMSDEQKKVDAQ